jgi:hypothetical protein
MLNYAYIEDCLREVVCPTQWRVDTVQSLPQTFLNHLKHFHKYNRVVVMAKNKVLGF